LLATLFVFLGLYVATQSAAYGRTFDEQLQDDFGHRMLRWYLTLGRDDSFRDFDAVLQMPQHGPFFETLVATAQAVTGEQWTTRAVVTGVAAVLGVLAIALCGFEIAGWWGAALAAAGLVGYPRYFGAMFNNSKDLPFTVAMIFVLWAALRLLRRGDLLVESTLVGAFIGVAASIRVVAVISYPLIAVVLAIRFRRDRPRPRLRRVFGAGLLVAAVSWLTMCLLWPYVFLNPVAHLVDSIDSMSRYPWAAEIPFSGEMHSAAALPARYTVEWLLVGSPPALVVLAAVGAVFAVRRPFDPRILLVGLALVVPVGALAITGATMYNALRHFLFVVPPIVLLAAYGLVRLFRACRHGWQRVALACVTVAAQVQLITTMIALRPYEYSYFSPVAGGLPGAVGRYELDYWGSCNTHAARWIAARVGRSAPDGTGPEKVRVDGTAPAFQFMTELPGDRFEFSDRDPDFFIWSIRERFEDRYPSYRTVHLVSVQDYAMCVVKARTH
jgi:hypothetical protein